MRAHLWGVGTQEWHACVLVEGHLVPMTQAYPKELPPTEILGKALKTDVQKSYSLQPKLANV